MKSRFLIISALGIIGFTGITFAEHDPNQPYMHSIILPADVKEKTFDEFMEWCEPHYEKRKCTELYEKNPPQHVPPLIDFEFVGLMDTYQLDEKFIIKFEKTTQQPCPSYEISIMKDGLPESKITYGVESMCAIPGPVEPYLFTDVFSKPEFFDTAGTYHIEVKLDGDTILKKIEILDKTFSIIQKQVKYVIPYQITGGTIDDMKLNCDSASLVLSISSSDAGILELDMPHRMLSIIFMVLVDEVEPDEASIDGNILTVNFPENTSKIEVFGGYYLSSDKYTGVCDVSHDPPYSYILSPLQQIKSGIKFHNVICKDGFELVYKKTDDTSACVTLNTEIELVVRGWAEDNRVLLGCTGERYNKCYPEDKNEYREVLQKYYGIENEN